MMLKAHCDMFGVAGASGDHIGAATASDPRAGWRVACPGETVRSQHLRMHQKDGDGSFVIVICVTL